MKGKVVWNEPADNTRKFDDQIFPSYNEHDKRFHKDKPFTTQCTNVAVFLVPMAVFSSLYAALLELCGTCDLRWQSATVLVLAGEWVFSTTTTDPVIRTLDLDPASKLRAAGPRMMLGIRVLGVVLGHVP